MTEDQMMRSAIVGASMPITAWLIQKAKAKLSAARNKRGCSLPQHIGYRLGLLWASGYRAAKKRLHG